uniref:Uncharacterized protein n=1 Tax=Strombidium inclinatum TaxID=197538 RepID=A0A7S3MW05_9SPIT|mmetsp:Transcript_19603/g.30201  ORF Transcript_19603/g.30201 Transcript_19603/m.30201 type:complete len:129 (+) Transcript_19603:28-414(+)
MNAESTSRRSAVSASIPHLAPGLTPYQPHAPPNWADPDHPSYHLFSAAILGASFAGRWYAPKIGVTRMPFTASILLVPIFYLLAINHKEKRFAYSAEGRRSLDQNLEFYPITRRAFNKAKAIREQELQ